MTRTESILKCYLDFFLNSDFLSFVLSTTTIIIISVILLNELSMHLHIYEPLVTCEATHLYRIMPQINYIDRINWIEMFLNLFAFQP